LRNLGIDWISDIKICFVEMRRELNWFTIMSSGRILWWLYKSSDSIAIGYFLTRKVTTVTTTSDGLCTIKFLFLNSRTGAELSPLVLQSQNGVYCQYSMGKEYRVPKEVQLLGENVFRLPLIHHKSCLHYPEIEESVLLWWQACD
jgi:hypothetical protein